MRFKAKRCATLEAVRIWVNAERSGPARANKAGGKAINPSVSMSVKICALPGVPSSAQLVANAALLLLNLACHLLDNQIAAQAKAFLEAGGFSERLYRVCSERRTRGQTHCPKQTPRFYCIVTA